MRHAPDCLACAGFSAVRAAFQTGADGGDDGLLIGLEHVGRVAGRAIAFAHQAQHLDGGDQCGDGKLLEWSTFGHTRGLDVEALVFIVRNNCSMVQRWR